MGKKFYLGGMILTGFLLLGFSNDFSNKNESFKNIDEAYSYGPIVVLELFTSQGCSSCPSADLLLQKVKKEYKKEVFALSYHVDYWNYIGWKDPFSKAKYADKQREYNIKFRNRSNYTPQLVVNGSEHFVGSNSSKMYDVIDAYKEKKSANQINLKEISPSGNKVTFTYHIEGNLQDKIIRTLLVLDERTTSVKRGENRNRTLQNSNIVVAEKSFLIENSSGSMEITIPSIVTKNDKLNLIVLLENKGYDITAATKQRLVRQR